MRIILVAKYRPYWHLRHDDESWFDFHDRIDAMLDAKDNIEVAKDNNKVITAVNLLNKAITAANMPNKASTPNKPNKLKKPTKMLPDITQADCIPDTNMPGYSPDIKKPCLCFDIIKEDDESNTAADYARVVAHNLELMQQVAELKADFTKLHEDFTKQADCNPGTKMPPPLSEPKTDNTQPDCEPDPKNFMKPDFTMLHEDFTKQADCNLGIKMPPPLNDPKTDNTQSDCEPDPKNFKNFKKPDFTKLYFQKPKKLGITQPDFEPDSKMPDGYFYTKMPPPLTRPLMPYKNKPNKPKKPSPWAVFKKPDVEPDTKNSMMVDIKMPPPPKSRTRG
jgi:hypothetical protein